MTELNWLTGLRCKSLTKREFDWVLDFDDGVHIVVECLWRFIEGGRIRVTSQDEGHKFGLPAPVDAAAEVTIRIAGVIVEGVELREGILDLELQLSTGHVIQIIPNSAGYEAWNVGGANKRFIAVGGGDLSIFGGE